jgi:hypothetical protein
MNIHLKNEILESRGEGDTHGRRRVNGEGEGGDIWLMYFIHLCENKSSETC